MRQQSVCRSLCVSHLLCVTRFSVCDTFFCVCNPPFVVKHHVIHRSHEYHSILCLHFYRFQILFWTFCGGIIAINPHTWILSQSSSQYWKYDPPPSSCDISQEFSCQKSVCTPFSWIHNGVESYVLEDESINGVSSARLSSRNCGPNSVLSMDFSLYTNGLLSRMQSMKDCCCCCRCRHCCFRGGRDFPALWRQRFPDACQKVCPSFQRCSNLANLTRDIPRQAWKIRST